MRNCQSESQSRITLIRQHGLLLMFTCLKTRRSSHDAYCVTAAPVTRVRVWRDKGSVGDTEGTGAHTVVTHGT